MLELPMEVSIRNPVTREVTEGIPMWIYWSLQRARWALTPNFRSPTTVPCHRSFMDTDAHSTPTRMGD